MMDTLFLYQFRHNVIFVMTNLSTIYTFVSI